MAHLSKGVCFVSLPSAVATQVERYAETVDASMSKAIAALVRLGLKSQENRKREFFRKLKANLAEDDPGNRTESWMSPAL